MKIEFTKDLDTFKENFFWGLSLKETMYSAIGLLVSGLGVYVLNTFLIRNILVCTYISMLLSGPIFLQGFWTYNGLSFKQYLLKWWKVKSSKALYYVAEDGYVKELKTKKNLTELILDYMISKKNEKDKEV